MIAFIKYIYSNLSENTLMKTRMRKLGNLVLFSAAVLTLNVALWGQATNSADVTGSVTDPSGAALGLRLGAARSAVA